MRYNRLGNTGLFVSELCLGTMTFGGGGFWEPIGNLQQDDADALVRRAVDAGVNFIDTANVYSAGVSEEITGRAIRNLGLKRDEVVLATKVFGQMGDGPNGRGASRAHIMEQVKQSLKRLDTDYIDLYQIHGWDPVTPIEEQLRALDTLVQHGHVRYIGVSNWAAWQVMKALGISERQGLARFETLQAYYTIGGRDLEREIVPMLRSEQVGLMVWSPLSGGYLSGKYRGAEAEGRRVNFDFPPLDKTRADRVVEAMAPIADAHGRSIAQVALAWLLHQPVVTTVIMGAKRVDQLDDNLAAATLELTRDELAALDAVSALPPEYPGWMFTMQGRYRAEMLAQPPHGA
ncbi:MULTISPECIES: aldo/keto reductase [unclassified Sphingomonas]|uniref:aldo/keto reductase n=1 Tax=unclassified Sphingomonas TaxID=196159 RepID=UPI00083799D2|nr:MULTISPECIES: aldo/keto reductase [unclassified Sphingomonas]